jgi:hypothetical protein
MFPMLPHADPSVCSLLVDALSRGFPPWVLLGTRMPVSVIFETLEAGANIDDILERFEGLDREQMKAVIEFAARSLDEAPFASTRCCLSSSIRELL